MTQSARQRLIDSTIELVRTHGVAGTAVADLLTHSGTARQSIYQHFPGGKTELVAEAVRSAGSWIGRMIDEIATTHSVRELLGAFVAYWKWTLERSDYRAGCPIAAAALSGDEAPEAKENARESFANWQARLVTLAVAQGMPEPAADALATTVVAAVEGAVMLCLATRSTDPLTRVHGQLDELIRFQFAGLRTRPAGDTVPNETASR
ncbi:Uncharacterized HTH-type transcriptional regulator yxaF [Nocardia farcinica]|uniref:Uncharacterized HTH-type transcriptional regulator yxaF n=1 Tax=Nocardia farcinica TaxID=37329 RepID=A0A449GZR6_NOCFR|nr:TetR/AcrR family transcriptional regulator [Nocardia farcinica]VFA91140.1 Uncharacterized HTH-type transcriptional regulator yxaF [Nocardia farcinica]